MGKKLAVLKLKYVNEYRDRHGRLRRDFRKGAIRRPLPGEVGSPEFMAAYQRALAHAGPLEIGARRFNPKSMDALITCYLKSDAFTKALAPETQRMRRNILDRFRTKPGDKSAATLEQRHIAAML